MGPLGGSIHVIHVQNNGVFSSMSTTMVYYIMTKLGGELINESKKSPPNYE